MTWPIDKLTLINQQLALSGNNTVTAVEDGSDEWNVGSAAYEYAFEYALDNHGWKQLTNVVTLNPTGAAPADSQFDTAYAKPADCVHVIWVRYNQSGATGGANVPILYQILNNQIVVNLFGQQPGVTPVPGTPTPVVTMKYVSSNPPGLVVNGVAQPTTAAGQMLRTFMTSLSRFVLAGIYRGLHKDIQSARATEQEAMALLAEARRRSDQEQPKRAPFNSRITASRRVRRPFPQTPTGWGGTGTPG
jgi:hypothetical protein